MPSVTMNGGIAALVTRKPLTAPVRAPVARHPRMPIHHGRSRFDVSIAPTTPESARIEPTERSMPADEMTKVMPIAKTPNTEVESRMLRMLETERKALDSTAITTQSRMRTASDSRRTAAPPAMRWRHEAVAAGVAFEVTGPSSDSIDAPPAQGEGSERRVSLAAAYFTYCSSGSLFASMTSLVRTSVGT